LRIQLPALRGCVRGLLRFLGKSGNKVAVVFGSSQESCHKAVLHLRNGAPGVPVVLFATVKPLAVTAALCECVVVRSRALELVMAAERDLWRRSVAISVGAWSGERRQWLVKWAPFLIPPFRVLLLNGHGDFLPGTPRHILAHALRVWRDRGTRFGQGAREAVHSASDCGRTVWRKTIHLGLLAAASVLRLAGYPHRRWYQRWRRTGTLALSTQASARGGIAEFTQSGAHWDGAALERFAESTNARWIYWRQGGGNGDETSELTGPFTDSRAFAVSRQRYFRAWKPSLLPTAPFRTLQAGEASRVLAPVAPAVLVDRQKLLALGIPRCHLAETAWMLCFWKAAAAGWRAFSVGQDQALSEEPDRPVQETEFLLRMAMDPALRRLAPAEPELARGSIAFAPRGECVAARAGDRPKVLLVSPFLPFPLSHGGAVRIYNLCRRLASRVDFVLIALREKDEGVEYARLQEIFREVYVVDIDERASGDAEWPGQVRQSQSQPLRALIAEVVREWRPDLLQIEYTHMAAYRECAPDVPALLVEHDLTFSLYGQLAEERPGEEARREYLRWLAFERRWLADYDGVWTVSPDDCRRAITEGGRSEEDTFLVPNGVDTRRFAACKERAGALEILYVGSFRHLPNVLGFEHLRREIMPRVWERFPEARLRVVAGKDFERYWIGRCDSRIDLQGFVEDLRPRYASASVVVVPLGVSAGTNIKVLEAMACGKAVVSTPAGCAGLGLHEGQDVLIRAGWEGFAEAVCELLERPGERARLGSHARRTAELRFGWEKIADEAYGSYMALLEQDASDLDMRAAAAG